MHFCLWHVTYADIADPWATSGKGMAGHAQKCSLELIKFLKELILIRMYTYKSRMWIAAAGPAPHQQVRAVVVTCTLCEVLHHIIVRARPSLMCTLHLQMPVGQSCTICKCSAHAWLAMTLM